MRRRTKVWTSAIAGGCLLAVLLGWGALKYASEYWKEPSAASSSTSRLPQLRPQRSQRLYAQFGQDRWIIQRVFPGVTNGYFVDVGAGDGVKGSNTKALEELGWTGVAIGAFTIEHNFEEPKRQQIRELLEKNGYRFVREQVVDDWYLSDDLKR